MNVFDSVMDVELLAALEAWGAVRVPHSGRLLADHLAGTCRLLAQWGCDADVCRAGLFHSIYGTLSFKQACLQGDQRSRLAMLIGPTAERLVYLFSIADRPSGLLTAVLSGQLSCHGGRVQMPVTLEESRRLLAVESANLVEQGDLQGFVEAIRRLPEETRESLLGPEVAAGILAKNGA